MFDILAARDVGNSIDEEEEVTVKEVSYDSLKPKLLNSKPKHALLASFLVFKLTQKAFPHHVSRFAALVLSLYSTFQDGYSCHRFSVFSVFLAYNIIEERLAEVLSSIMDK